eukprot:g6634.t1
MPAGSRMLSSAAGPSSAAVGDMTYVWSVTFFIIFLALSLKGAWMLYEHAVQPQPRRAVPNGCLSRASQYFKRDRKTTILALTELGLLMRCLWLLSPGFLLEDVVNLDEAREMVHSVPWGPQAKFMLFNVAQLMWLIAWPCLVLMWRSASLAAGLHVRLSRREELRAQVCAAASIGTMVVAAFSLYGMSVAGAHVDGNGKHSFTDADSSGKLYVMLAGAIMFAYVVGWCLVAFVYVRDLSANCAGMCSTRVQHFVRRVRQVFAIALVSIVLTIGAFFFRYTYVPKASARAYVAFLYVLSLGEVVTGALLLFAVDVRPVMNTSPWYAFFGCCCAHGVARSSRAKRAGREGARTPSVQLVDGAGAGAGAPRSDTHIDNIDNIDIDMQHAATTSFDNPALHVAEESDGVQDVANNWR